MAKDKKYLQRAIEIAADGIFHNGGPFGALIVRNNKVIAEAFNSVVLTNDPTAHAEILVIREASKILQTHELYDCTLYSSCEPCPMCLGAIYWSGIKKVVYACDRTDAERAGFSDKLIYGEIGLEPSKRKLSFIRLTDQGGNDVFRRWDELENKITY